MHLSRVPRLTKSAESAVSGKLPCSLSVSTNILPVESWNPMKPYGLCQHTEGPPPPTTPEHPNEVTWQRRKSYHLETWRYSNKGFLEGLVDFFLCKDSVFFLHLTSTMTWDSKCCTCHISQKEVAADPPLWRGGPAEGRSRWEWLQAIRLAKKNDWQKETWTEGLCF